MKARAHSRAHRRDNNQLQVISEMYYVAKEGAIAKKNGNRISTCNTTTA